MILTIKNADDKILEVIEKFIKLSPKSYEIEKSFNTKYIQELETIVNDVENGSMPTYDEIEFEKSMKQFREKLTKKYGYN